MKHFSLVVCWVCGLVSASAQVDSSGLRWSGRFTADGDFSGNFYDMKQQYIDSIMRSILPIARPHPVNNFTPSDGYLIPQYTIPNWPNALYAACWNPVKIDLVQLLELAVRNSRISVSQRDSILTTGINPAIMVRGGTAEVSRISALDLVLIPSGGPYGIYITHYDGGQAFKLAEFKCAVLLPPDPLLFYSADTTTKNLLKRGEKVWKITTTQPANQHVEFSGDSAFTADFWQDAKYEYAFEINDGHGTIRHVRGMMQGTQSISISELLGTENAGTYEVKFWYERLYYRRQSIDDALGAGGHDNVIPWPQLRTPDAELRIVVEP